jgi:hypothetical protein
MSILTNIFGMMNTPLSSRFLPGGSQFKAMGNPQRGATSAGRNVYNPHYTVPTGMVSMQPLMNQFGGGYYSTRQGHGVYQNNGWSTIPQHQPFLGAWAQMPQP